MTERQKPKKPRKPSKPDAKPRPRPRPKPSRNGQCWQQVLYEVDQLPPNEGPQPQPLPPPDVRNGIGTEGRLMAEVRSSPVSWFVDQWIPRGSLTLVVGARNSGKSSLGAWLASLAHKPAILPGWEESTEHMLVPRLAKNGVNPRNCRIFDQRAVSVPADIRWLTGVMRTHGCDFLWIDPLDTVMSEESRRDGSAVRAGLEALSRMANDLRIPVLGVRHPGKQAGNVCRGFTEWQDVPRQILEVMHDKGPPERRMVRRWKDPWGWGRQPREFTLEGEDGQPRIFTLGAAVTDEDAEETAQIDRVDRWQISLAEKVIKAVLRDVEQESTVVYAACERERIGERTVRRAALRIPVFIYRKGSGANHRSVWSLTELDWTEDSPATPDSHGDTPSPPLSL